MKRILGCLLLLAMIIEVGCNNNSSGNLTEDRVKTEQKALKKKSKQEKNMDKLHAKENLKNEKLRRKADEKSGSVIEVPKGERGVEEAKRDKKDVDKGLF